MIKIIIIIAGIALNIFASMYLHFTKRDINTIVPNIYVFFVLPLLIIAALTISVAYDFLKKKNKDQLASKILIILFLSMSVVQYLFIVDGVYAK
jgi:hypothetical protein